MSIRRAAKRRGIALAWLAVGMFVAAGAGAVIPDAGRVTSAAAKQNRAAGRAQALRVEVLMRDGQSEPIGRGSLVSHPSGLARLELRGAGNLVERHLLQGSEHLAVRGGEVLTAPREFLPPLFLLQADSLLALQTGLRGLGADVASIGLAPCGESDCYVIGDPGRVPPKFEAPMPVLPTEDELPLIKKLLAGAPYVMPDVEGLAGAELETTERLLLGGPFATLWVDLLSYEIKRIDLQSGVVVWLGPPKSFGRVQAPAWFRVDEPGRAEIRFDVLEVAPVDAAAAAFSKTWLYAPVVSPRSSGEDPSSDAGATPEPLSRENH